MNSKLLIFFIALVFIVMGITDAVGLVFGENDETLEEARGV